MARPPATLSFATVQLALQQEGRNPTHSKDLMLTKRWEELSGQLQRDCRDWLAYELGLSELVLAPAGFSSLF